MKKLVIGIVGFLAIVGFGVYLASQDGENNKQAGVDQSAPLQGEEVAGLTASHIDEGDSHEAYNSNPPTSGAHLATAARWGVYQEALSDEQLVHNLEHGGIWISYKDIDPETKANIERIGRSNPGSVIVTPRAQNDSKIAVASWKRLMKLDFYDEQKILDFIKANINNSPEPLATPS